MSHDVMTTAAKKIYHRAEKNAEPLFRTTVVYRHRQTQGMYFRGGGPFVNIVNTNSRPREEVSVNILFPIIALYSEPYSLV